MIRGHLNYTAISTTLTDTTRETRVGLTVTQHRRADLGAVLCRAGEHERRAVAHVLVV